MFEATSSQHCEDKPQGGSEIPGTAFQSESEAATSSAIGTAHGPAVPANSRGCAGIWEGGRGGLEDEERWV